jgi:prepilin-type N-terminal cleavage/methylation domain-containing protein/prepilin-type processing-associated H-X9-DG protein
MYRTQPHRSLRNVGGFSLIELLVVIAVLGLLVSILTPSLSRAAEFGRRTKCATNLHALAVAFRMYLNDSNDIMPVAAAMPSLGLNDDPALCDVLEPHLDDSRVLECPSDDEVDYFQREGSSYEYHTMLGGQKVSEDWLTERLGEDQRPVLNDYEPFHGKPGTPGAMNYLFVDGSVGDLGG